MIWLNYVDMDIERRRKKIIIFLSCEKICFSCNGTYVKLNPKYSQIAIWGDFSLQLNIRWWCFVRATQQGTIFLVVRNIPLTKSHIGK